MLSWLREWDRRAVLRLTALEQVRGVRPVMLAATRAGDGWGLLVIVPTCLLLWHGRGTVAVGCGVVLGVVEALLVAGLKALVRRPRPSGFVLARPIGAPDVWAFPSGHATHAFGVLALALWLDPRLAACLALVMVAIAISRVFFGLHHPSDVLFGALSGFAMGSLAIRLVAATGLASRVMAAWPMG